MKYIKINEDYSIKYQDDVDRQIENTIMKKATKYYSKRLDDVCKRYRSNKNTESDIIKLDIVSELTNLKADLEKYIIISNNQTEIDTYLEELKEEANQYRKARH